MSKINVLGLGPGNPEYILPIVFKIAGNSQVLIGGKRNLEYFDTGLIETKIIGNNLNELIIYIKENRETKIISVLVSGDPGFYSMLGILRKHFNSDDLNVVPGISSFQYLFCRLGKTWENYYPGSIHGKNEDIAEVIQKYKNAFFLTDEVNSYRKIALELNEKGFGEKMMYVGNNLSYEDEFIIFDRVKNMKDKDYKFNLAVVVVCDE